MFLKGESSVKIMSLSQRGRVVESSSQVKWYRLYCWRVKMCCFVYKKNNSNGTGKIMLWKRRPSLFQVCNTIKFCMPLKNHYNNTGVLWWWFVLH